MTRRRRKIKTIRMLQLALPSLLFVSLCVVMCTPVRHGEGDGSVMATAEADMAEEMAEALPRMKGLSIADLENADSVSHHLRRLPQMPEPTQKMKVNYFGNIRQIFNDSNHVHMTEAEKIGIAPLSDTRSHWQMRRPIVRITTCEDYFLDTLIFSRPYLVPEAAVTLREIGRRFRDTISARGGGDYRIKVTSLLRTPATIKRLRRRNRNAIDSSVHRYGTTFDISYASFVAGAPAPARSVDDLKGVLAEVLKAMREEGKLWVKYERGQPCFHITARRRD